MSGLLQRVRSAGVRAASPIDLLAVGFSRRESDVDANEHASRAFLKKIGSLRALGNASKRDLEEASGLEDFEAIRFQALVELGRRLAVLKTDDRDTIDSVEDVVALLDDLRFEKREHFVAILLDAKSHIIRVATIHVGTLTASLVGPREVFREAIRDGASSLVVAHNHPSGDPTPSPEDIEITRQLVEVGRMLDIPVLDHVILGERRFKSLSREGHV